MKTNIFWSTVSFFVVAVLVLISCGPKAVPAPALPAPTTQTSTMTTPATPALVPAPPIAPENTITVTLKKLDGTAMKKTVEKPKYGGILTLQTTGIAAYTWNPGDPKAHSAQKSDLLAIEQLAAGDWARGTAGTGEVSWQIYEYLSLDHHTGKLAERWETPDNETIVFHLRKGVHWALDGREASQLVGGRELTANDVVRSIKWVLDGPKSALRAYITDMADVKDVYAADKYTVVIKGPSHQLGSTLVAIGDIISVVPPEIIDKYGGFTEWNKIVGTGPFVIKDFFPGSMVTWIKNPDYWGYDPVLGKDYRLPYVDTLKFLQIVDQSTAEAAFRTGRLDGTLTLSKEQWQSMIKTYPVAKTKIIDFATSSNRIAMQMDNKKAPWQDVRVRRALMMATDRQSIIDLYYQGAADLQGVPMPTAPELVQMGWSIPLKELPEETQELYKYNPAKAKQLLAEAGYPNGFKTSLMLSATGAEALDVAQIVKEQWVAIGVDLILDIKEAGVYNKYHDGLDFPEMLHTGRWAFASRYGYYDYPNSLNPGNINDSYIKEQRKKMTEVLWDVEKRTPMMRELNKYVLAQAYYISLPSKWSYKVYQPWVKNYDAEASVSYRSVTWQFVWIDQDLKGKLTGRR